MSLRLFYVDESYDATKFCLSAISIRHVDWHVALGLVQEHRRSLKTDFGMFYNKEIHARDFVAGRGRYAPGDIFKWQRARIFAGVLNLVAKLPKVFLVNVCLEAKGHSDVQMVAWDRLINRIERTLLAFEDHELPLRRKLMESIKPHLEESDYIKLNDRLTGFASRAIIVSDEGREVEITKALRKMGKFNPITSKYGVWAGGGKTKNITTERIIEDPFFRASDKSLFLQLADCVSFALLKREVPPTPNIKKYHIDTMFETHLASVCRRACSPKDPLGIARK